jgi:hypothetical protein
MKFVAIHFYAGLFGKGFPLEVWTVGAMLAPFLQAPNHLGVTPVEQ